MMRRSFGFTLIEILIVVAIIAILSAIAVPNFLEAQTRSKVSRAHADMHSMVTALEVYRIDGNHYPPAAELGYGMESDTEASTHWQVPSYLSTPVAYITSIPEDPFANPSKAQLRGSIYSQEEVKSLVKRYWYYNVDKTLREKPDSELRKRLSRAAGAWVIYSYGPDLLPFNISGGVTLPWNEDTSVEVYESEFTNYDPSNGTLSAGNIFRTQMNTDKYVE